MNKQYMVDEDGIVTVITYNEDIIEREEPYTKSTGTTLYLENMIESIDGKIQFLSKRIGELNNSIKNKTKIIRYINILLILLVFTTLVLGVAISSILLLASSILSIPFAGIIKKIENTIIEKDKEKRNDYKDRVQEEIYKITKINKKLKSLSKDKINIESKLINIPMEVRPLGNYTIDSSDYFVESYLIDKRVKEMKKNTPKVKIKIRKKHPIEYEI